MSRRATSGQDTARSVGGSHTALTYVISLGAQLFEKSLFPAAILPPCTAVHCLLCRAILLFAGLSQPDMETKH